MFSVIGFVIVLIINAKCYSDEDLIKDGWKPLSSEEVFNVHRKLLKPSHKTITNRDWNPVLLAEENILQAGLNSNMEPHDINRELMSNTDYIGFDENQVDFTDEKQNHNSEYKITHKPLEERLRQAKNIIDNQENSYMNIQRHNKNNMIDMFETALPEKVKIKETNFVNDESNIYEVTEVSEVSDIKDLLNDDQSRINANKAFFEPDVTTTTEKNLSNILLNILGNYNIKINDDLTNYAQSRKRPNSHKQKYGFWTPFKIQPMRNSENFLPLDPFLAVFLSNYGFYLPGYYGFPGNYYNIYGYLASNNIHNNKPFGAYKIYSDTDSSH